MKIVKRNKHEALYGLRAFCFLMVFILHFLNLFDNSSIYQESSLFYILESFRKQYIFVDVFFILSGFLICESIQHYTNIFSFLKKRLLRIYPPVILTTIPLIFSNKSFAALFDNFTLLMFFRSDYWNFINWSLSYEIYFYILFSFTFFTYKKSITLAFLPIFIFYLILFKLQALGAEGLIRTSSFIFGIIAFLIKEKVKNISFFINIPSQFLLCLLIFTGLIRQLTHFSNLLIPYYFINYILISLLIIQICFKENTLSKLFKNPFFNYIGKRSYSFYLVHAVYGLNISLWSAHIIFNKTTVLSTLFVLVLSLSLTYIFGNIVYNLCEKHFLQGRINK